MPQFLLTAAGYVLAAAVSGLAIYYWRRSAGLYSLLVEGANRFEEMRVRSHALEQAVGKTDERMKQHRDQTSKLEQAVEDARTKTTELTRRVEAKEQEARAISEKLELQKGHLEKMLVKAEGKLTQADAARADLAEELRIAQLGLAAAAEEMQIKERDWRGRHAEMERAQASADKRSKGADPIELKRLKRKIAQYDRLYASMKGLREMTEERNRNWEVALRKMSSWIIIETKKVHPGNEPKEIGPLVGLALQIIGAQLIDDDEGMDPRGAGAARAHEMDDDLSLDDPALLDDPTDLEEAT